MRHEIKCWPQYFQRVVDGTKTFEIRNNDRGYQAEDIVFMHEWDPKTEDYTGRAVMFSVGYVYPLSEERVIISICRPQLDTNNLGPEE